MNVLTKNIVYLTSYIKVIIMKQSLKLFAITILLLFNFSCTEEVDLAGIPLTNHIQFFGFTLIDTYWDDPTDNEIKTNYIDEVHSFSNVADILVVTPTDNIINRMSAIKNLQMKSILHVSELFFEQVGTGGQSGAEFNLRADYKERWNTFIATNQLQTNKNLVQAFYIGEEPTWNSISFTELKAATDFVKSTITTVPIMIIEAYPAIGNLQIPSSVDWVGFDHYAIKDPKNNATFKSEFNLLKSKINDSQRLIMVMDTHYISTLHGDIGGITLNEMKNVAKSYFDFANAEPKVIAILGYFWPSGFDNNSSIGARNMPQAVKDEYVRFGKMITGKN